MTEIGTRFGDHPLQRRDETGHRSSVPGLLDPMAKPLRDRADHLDDHPAQLLVHHRPWQRRHERRVVPVHAGRPCLLDPSGRIRALMP
ncbi:hypothetical protein AB0L59_27270 [Streptomyces sp. NPDC052109]|uniref:hypothetical protein n=1 Tax=Streptomyces sp. NPDC052109 TaxID=3155527 RepID=UPI003434D683